MKRAKPQHVGLFYGNPKRAKRSQKDPAAFVTAQPYPEYESIPAMARSPPGIRRIWHTGNNSVLGTHWNKIVQHCAVYEFEKTAGWKTQIAAFFAAGQQASAKGKVYGALSANSAVMFVSRCSRAVMVSVAHVATMKQCGPSPLVTETSFFNTTRVSGGWTCDTDTPPMLGRNLMYAACNPETATFWDQTAALVVPLEHAEWVKMTPQIKITTTHGTSAHQVTKVGRETQQTKNGRMAATKLHLAPPFAAVGKGLITIMPHVVPPALHTSVSPIARLNALTGVRWTQMTPGTPLADQCATMDFTASLEMLTQHHKAHSIAARALQEASPDQCIDAQRTKKETKAALTAAQREYTHAGGKWQNVAHAPVKKLLASTNAAAGIVARGTAAPTAKKSLGGIYAFITKIAGVPSVVVDTETVTASDYRHMWAEHEAAFVKTNKEAMEADPEARRFIGKGQATKTVHTMEAIKEKLPPCITAVLPGGWAHKEAKEGKQGTFDRMKYVERWTVATVLKGCKGVAVTEIEDLLGPALVGAKNAASAEAKSATTHCKQSFIRAKTQIKGCRTLAADPTFRMCNDASRCSALTHGILQTPLSVSIAYSVK